mmetsp:Transcript_9660/g.35846  ORF Transcript_9660/g.35846 Transcript_9660/m.35846 type:complete len:278 (+) Transcript_9660:181-1014(+)
MRKTWFGKSRNTWKSTTFPSPSKGTINSMASRLTKYASLDCIAHPFSRITHIVSPYLSHWHFSGHPLSVFSALNSLPSSKLNGRYDMRSKLQSVRFSNPSRPYQSPCAHTTSWSPRVSCSKIAKILMSSFANASLIAAECALLAFSQCFVSSPSPAQASRVYPLTKVVFSASSCGIINVSHISVQITYTASAYFKTPCAVTLMRVASSGPTLFGVENASPQYRSCPSFGTVALELVSDWSLSSRLRSRLRSASLAIITACPNRASPADCPPDGASPR